MRDIVGRLANVYDDGILIARGYIEAQEDLEYPYVVIYTLKFDTHCYKCSFKEIGVNEFGLTVELVGEE